MTLDPRFPDFDMMMSLYRDDPQAFEAFRRHVLREAVDAAPPDQRPALELLIGRLDAARLGAATPMEAALVAFRMMQESVGQLHIVWRQTRQIVVGLETSMLMVRLRRV
ncbi:MAG: DUF3135 domain-containing protein [Oxalobacteraceae bacterium]